MITVIVPVLNRLEETEEFLESIFNNIYLPEEIIFIDNGSDFNSVAALLDKYKGLPIKYIRHEVNIGVNAAWTEGIGLAKTKLVSILNNDIIVNKYFFSNIIAAMKNPQIGVITPHTVDKKEDIEQQLTTSKVCVTKKCEGWAFTVKKYLLNVIPPIPKELNIFFGDDWFWHQTTINGMLWCKDQENIIYHRPGVSGNPKFEKVLKTEREIFKQIKIQNRW